MKKRLLFLSAHCPARLSRHAANKTVFRNLQVLSQEYDVDLVTFRSRDYRSEPAEEVVKLCSSIRILDLTALGRFSILAKGWSLPLLVAARSRAGLERSIKEQVAARAYDRVHCEFGQMAQYLKLCSGIRERTVYLHDVMSQWAGRRILPEAWSRFFWKWETARTRRWELAHYSQATRLYVPSDKDRHLLRELGGGLDKLVQVVPLYYDHYAGHHGRPPPRGMAPPTAVFLGALGRPENRDAVIWLRDEVAPLVAKTISGFRVMVVGDDPSGKMARGATETLVFTGYVERLGEIFAQAHLALLPVFVGAGVKVKVLECLAAGLPVVTTEVGAEGIEANAGDGLLVLPADATRFAAKAVEILSDQALCARLGEGAYRWGKRQSRDQCSAFLRGV